MINQYGLLTRSNKAEVQDTIRDPEFSSLLYKLFIQDGPAFLGDLNGWCTTSSRNRCCFYMSLNYENKAYAQKGRKISYILPTYGVKGTDAISRDMKYVNQYIQTFEDMMGGTFIDYVFGTPYIGHEEPQSLVSKTETVERLRCKLKKTSHQVEQEDLVCRIVERIWDARERDSKTRVVLVLEDAEETSMDLLRQIYLLLPQRLRLQTGFETNAAAGDFDVISKNSMPIYLLTVDRNDLEALNSNYLKNLKFPVEFIEVRAMDLYPCDAERVQALKYHCRQLDEVTELCMDYAERKVMEENKQDYSSFRIYGEILKKTYSEDLFWWRRSNLITIDQICAAYQDQKELMEIPALKKEAVHSFYMKQISVGDIAEQIVDVICDDQYPNREMILETLRDDFSFGKELDAIEKYYQKRNAEEKTKLLQQDEELQQKMEQALKAQLDEHTDALKAKDQELQALANEKQKMKFSMEQEILEQRQAHEKMLQKKEDEYRSLESKKHNLEREQKRLQDKMEDMTRKYQDDPESLAGLKRRYDAAERKKKRAQTTRNVFIALTVIFVLAGIGTTVFGLMKMKELNQVESELNRMSEAESARLSEEAAEAASESDAESEKTRLESEAESEKVRLESEAESEKVRKSAEESEKARLESEAESEEAAKFAEEEAKMLSLY